MGQHSLHTVSELTRSRRIAPTLSPTDKRRDQHTARSSMSRTYIHDTEFFLRSTDEPGGGFVLEGVLSNEITTDLTAGFQPGPVTAKMPHIPRSPSLHPDP